MANEDEDDRDIPELPDILKEVEQEMARIKKQPGKDAATELIGGTVLSLMKDFIEATLLGFEEIQDQVNPVRLSGASAHEIGVLLKAALVSTPNLKDRIEPLLVELEQDEEDDEDADTN